MPVHDNAPPVVLVGGPTASGKSALALAVAEALNGIVINADSMQVYAELSILTARPGSAEMMRAPHRLYGVLPAAQRCSAALWQAMALREIEAAHAVGKRAVVVGGTGLYLRALTEGLAPIPAIPAEVRAAAIAMHASVGGHAIHARLAERDPETARRLKPGDTQRLVRAWEVLDATGVPLSRWQAQLPERPPYAFDCVLLLPPRDALYAACDRRFLGMIDQGALDEARGLAELALPPDLPAMKALGVPELLAHLRGELSLDDAVARAQQSTRNYAKRQLTWFRHQLRSSGGSDGRLRVRIAVAQFSESMTLEIMRFLDESV